MAEAVSHYERSFELDPASPLTVDALVSFHLIQRHMPDAIRVLRAATAASPNDPRLANSLAWFLATMPDEKLRDGPQALETARRAAELTKHQDPTVLRTLAAAYAETGDFDQAIRTAQRAIELAIVLQNEELAGALRTQLDLYRAGHPYRTPE